MGTYALKMFNMVQKKRDNKGRDHEESTGRSRNNKSCSFPNPLQISHRRIDFRDTWRILLIK